MIWRAPLQPRSAPPGGGFLSSGSRRSGIALRFNIHCIRTKFTWLTPRAGPVGDCYFDVMSLVERLHWRFLQLIKLELERIGITDIKAVQCARLFKMHDVETTITAMNLRGNVTYQLSKMVEAGYLTKEYQASDRRCAVIKLTD